MTRLFLIRHGEPSAAWGDDPDPGLSERGRDQAAAAAAALPAGLQARSSPLRRCRESAAPYLTRAGSPLALETRVSEVATPAGIGDRRAWLVDNFPWAGDAAPRVWADRDAALRDWRAQVLAGVRAMPEDSAVFTHFIAINAILGAALGRDQTIVCRPDFASITEIEISDGAITMVQLGAEMSVGEVR